MPRPDDFGLSPVQTLSHVGRPTPGSGHAPFWNRWGAEVWGERPSLIAISERDPAFATARSLGATHCISSLGGVRITGRLVEPQTAPRGAVLCLHGYADAGPIRDDPLWAKRGLAIFALRIRGFPGSDMDTGDLTAGQGGWIAQGLESGERWTLRGAVADVVNAFRALVERYGPSTPVSIRGESFGAGLAVIAGAQLAGRMRIFRMAIGLPSLAEWTWRLRLPARNGDDHSAGEQVRRWMTEHPAHADRAVELLRITDAVLHAPRIYCPVLCKLAIRDSVAPAPTAAAVYNALGTSPGRKWRYLTRYGHYVGGVADSRRHVQFDRLAGLFLDPAQDIIALMEEWAPRLTP